MRVLLLFLCIALTSCQSSDSKPKAQKAVTALSGGRMTMPYRLLIGGDLTPDQEQEVEHILATTFDETDQIYNKWNPDSELSRFNKEKAGTRCELSPELERLLLLTEEMVELSQGRFDPTIEPLQQLWKTNLAEGKEPTTEEIELASLAIGWNHLLLEEGAVTKDHDKSALDLGGIAKGLCVDLVVDRLNQAGYADVYFEWGGEIRASGQHPAQRPWTVFISRFGDTSPDNALDIVELSNQSIATSGDYMQNWQVEQETSSKTFFHILDPKHQTMLQKTEQSIGSVSVRSKSCAVADALATVGMMFSTVEEAESWAAEMEAKIPGTKFWISARDEDTNDPA